MTLVCGGCPLPTKRLVKGLCRKCYAAVKYLTNKEKILKQSAEWYAANKSRKNKTGDAWRKANRQKVRSAANKRRADNPEPSRESFIKWKKANPDRYRESVEAYEASEKGRALSRHKAALRRAVLLQRTPAWAEIKAIKEVYRLCPDGYEVDHYFPLQGELVSGLHVLENLQYLTERDNCKKNNKFPVSELKCTAECLPPELLWMCSPSFGATPRSFTRIA